MTQHRRAIEIGIGLPGLRLDLEDHRKHHHSPEWPLGDMESTRC
jgi:hypothetical protein